MYYHGKFFIILKKPMVIPFIKTQLKISFMYSISEKDYIILQSHPYFVFPLSLCIICPIIQLGEKVLQPIVKGHY